MKSEKTIKPGAVKPIPAASRTSGEAGGCDECDPLTFCHRRLNGKCATASQPQGVSGDALKKLIAPAAKAYKGYAKALKRGMDIGDAECHFAMRAYEVWEPLVAAALASAPQGVSCEARTVDDRLAAGEVCHSGACDENCAYPHCMGPAPAPQGVSPEATNEEVIARCARAGVKWLPPGTDAEGDDFPGMFDMVKMGEMRALLRLHDATTAQFIRAVEGPRSQGVSLSEERIVSRMPLDVQRSAPWLKSKWLTFARAIESELRSLAAPGQEGRAVHHFGWYEPDPANGGDCYHFGYIVPASVEKFDAYVRAAAPTQEVKDAEGKDAERFDFTAGAKKLAECMDYPWDHMPAQGRATMEGHAEAIVRAAIASKKGGEA